MQAAPKVVQAGYVYLHPYMDKLGVHSAATELHTSLHGRASGALCINRAGNGIFNHILQKYKLISLLLK